MPLGRYDHWEMKTRNQSARRWPQLTLLVVVALAAAALVALAFMPRQAPAGVGAEPVLTIASSEDAASATNSGGAPSASAPSATPAGAGLTVAFIGDSYTEGVGASDPSLRWTTLLAAANGWEELNLGVSGASYGQGLEEWNSYAVQVEEAIEAQPDVVIVSGGLNMSELDQELGVESVFTDLRAGLPDARIIAVSPFWVSTAYPAQLTLTSELIEADVTAVGGQYLDVGHLFEDEFQYFELDGLHPDDAGHQLIANAVDAGLPVEIGG